MTSFSPNSDRSSTDTTLAGTSLARSWEARSQSKSFSSGSESSFDGPVVNTAKFYASTEPLLRRPIQSLPVLPGPKLQEWAKCRDAIFRLLQSERFDIRSVTILNRRGFNSTETYPRVIIEAASIQERTRWTEIIISSWHVLHVQECLELGVEIVTQDPDWDMRVFAVGADHAVVDIWPNIRDKVVAFLRPYEWRALDMLLYGRTESKARPTIFITMEANSDDFWLGLQAQIKDLVDDIQVEIREGEIQQVTSKLNDETPTRSSPHRTYVQKIHGGWSIGVDARGSGTLGGFIKLCDPRRGTEEVYGMTNYHVVRPMVSTFPAGIDNGANASTWPSDYRKVQSPSRQDHDAEMFHLNDMTRETNSRWELSLKLRLKVEMQEATPLEIRRYNVLANEKDLFAARLQEVQGINDSDLDLGNVAFYSGFRTTKEKFALDWALIEARTSRIGQNRLPTQEEVSNRFSLEGARVDDINRDVETYPGRTFFKIGRTTALTIGRYSHTESAVRIPLPPNSEDGQGDAPRFRVSSEHVLVVEGGNIGDVFSRGGDSGSWVFDEVGSLAGMVWGCSEGNATYYTPIDFIIADIEERTGKKVELI